MHIVFYGDSLTKGTPGIPFLRVLGPMMPQHKLTNLGRGGDTVVSLCRRIVRSAAHESPDLAVLWIGVNDVLGTISWSHSALKWLMRQPRARSLHEFREAYDRILSCLRSSAQAILTVSPFLIGEDLSNPWNQRLEELSAIIESASAPYRCVEYVNLRDALTQNGSWREPSDYIPKSVTRIGLESLCLRRPEGVDKVASHRGLRLTLDGVHLNSSGAEMVAGALRRAIDAVFATKVRPLPSDDCS